MLTKKCSKCLDELDATYFYKNIRSKDGLCSRCKECQAKYIKQYYQNNKKKIIQSVSERAVKNSDTVREYKRSWYQKNLESVSRNGQRWRESNPERYKENRRAWASKNKARINHYSSLRRIRERNAGRHCSKAHIAEILEIYKMARWLTAETGIQHHVDHIFPLKGKNCSGLHVPWNLRIVTAEENLKKNAKMPDRADGLAFLRISSQ